MKELMEDAEGFINRIEPEQWKLAVSQKTERPYAAVNLTLKNVLLTAEDGTEYVAATVRLSAVATSLQLPEFATSAAPKATASSNKGVPAARMATLASSYRMARKQGMSHDAARTLITAKATEWGLDVDAITSAAEGGVKA